MWHAHLRMCVGVVCALVGVGGLCSCAADEDEKPRARLGALPFPGPFTLYVSSEMNELGPHHYSGPAGRPFGEQSEGARGIVYTCRAGFLDLAHLRETVDWTWWLRAHSRKLMVAGGGTFAFENDETGFELVIAIPPALSALPAAERAAVIDEAALKLGQRSAFMVETWHEIESWYGLRTVFFVPEDRSTFTWDDTASHAIGMQIGARLAGYTRKEYDSRAAGAIKAELEELDAVPKTWVDKAVYRVKGRWWAGDSPLRRDLQTGLTTGYKEPWIVPGLECCCGVDPLQLEVPSLKGVRGHDLSGMYEIRLNLNPAFAAEMYKGRPVPTTIDAEREFPVLIERLRADMKTKFGDDVDKP